MSTKRFAPLAALLLGAVSLRAQAAVLTVTSLADSGAGSLRQAIADADPGDTIEFDASLNGGTITLTSGALAFAKNLTIEGPGPDLLTIDGNAADRIFTLSPAASTTTINIGGLAMTNGVAVSGGAILTTTAWNTQVILLTLTNCLIRANQTTGAANTYIGGGGIGAARYTRLTLVDCTIQENHSIASGGGVWSYSLTHIERCLFVGNTTSSSGGGLLLRSAGPLTVVNSTFSGNKSFFSGWQTNLGGGALYTQENANVTIRNSTITENSTTRLCGGILSAGTVSMTLDSTIVAGNSDTQGKPDVSGTFTAVNHSLIQVTNGVSIVGSDNIFDVSPELETLADNGGPTRTHALKPGSLAIDKGSNPLSLATDQRGPGYPRLLGSAVDIGAYEFTPIPGGTVFTIR